MAKRAEIKCINKDDRYNPYERITHVGNAAEGWRLTLNDAIRNIQLEGWQFYVGGGSLLDPSVDVVIRTSPYGNLYLTTDPDGRGQNNLLNLPECR